MILECVWFEGKRVEENKITKPIDKLRLELVQIYSSISIILFSFKPTKPLRIKILRKFSIILDHSH
jgi:hypothetical protein